MSSLKPCLLFWCVCLALIMLPAVPAASDDTATNKAENEIQHANTYFWLGIAEQGDMEAFYKGLTHLESAEILLKNAGDHVETLPLMNQVQSLRESFLSQMEVHQDTLHGVFPAIRLLGVPIFSDALALGTFEVVDDPDVMAVTSAGRRLADDVIAKWSSRPQMHVIVNSTSADTSLEQEIVYIFSSLPKFYPYNARELRTVFTSREYDIFRHHTGGILPHDMVQKLCAHLNTEELLLVSIEKQDLVDDIHFYNVYGQVYNIHQPAPSHTFSHQGFSRDRNHYFWPGIVSFFIGILISIIAFRWVIHGNDFKMIFHLSGKDVAVPVVAFLIGRISPWVMMPIFSTLKPLPDTLFYLSFWWPCAVGVVLFFVPVIVYLRLNKYFCHVDDKFEITGNGAAILLSIAIGTCFYLLIPFMLYWDSIYGLVRVAGVFLISGFLMYWFGSVIDLADYKVSTKTVVSALYLIVTLFILSGAMFFGETLPFGDYWQSSSRTAGIGLLMIPAALAWGFGKIIKSKQEDIIAGSSDDQQQVDSQKKNELDAGQKPIHDIQLSRFGYWESETFYSRIRPEIEPLLQNRPEQFCCTWIKLTGPAGCGKTAAAKTVVRLIEQSLGIENITVFTGKCRLTAGNEHGNAPYEPFMKAFPRNIISPLMASKDSFSKLTEAFNPMDLVPSFMGLNALLADFDKDSERKNNAHRRNRLFTLVADYIRDKASEKKAVVIFLDNIQAMDPASRELLMFLSKKISPGQNLPVLFMVAFREETGDVAEPLESMGTSVSFPDPEPGDIREMLVHSIGLEDHAAERIVSQFRHLDMDNKLQAVFLYASTLYNHGILEETDDHRLKLAEKYCGPKTRLPDPENFATIIGHKLAQLTKRQRRVLSFAACLGYSIRIDIMETCLEQLPVMDILEDIDVKTGLIFDNPEMEGCYSFRDEPTLAHVRKLLNITLGGPPWSRAEEKIKKIHEQIAVCLAKMAETQFDYIFDACHHYYRSGGKNAETTIQLCMAAVDTARKNYNFATAEEYLKMAAECGDYIGAGFNFEEETLLLECDKAHVQNINNCEIADTCIDFYEKNENAVSNRVLKVVARICYEADRDKASHVCKLDNPDKYLVVGRQAAMQLLSEADDDFSRAEACFFIAINEKDDDTAIQYLKQCQGYLETSDPDDGQVKDMLGSWVYDVLARKWLKKHPEDHATTSAWFKKSIDHKKRLHDRPGLSRSYGGLGACMVTSRQYDKARQFFEKSLKYAREVEDGFGIYLRHYDLGDSYLNEAKDDCCTDRNNCYHSAMEHFEKGLEMVENLDESKKDASLYHLYAGLLLSSAMCEAWDRYNLYGEKLQTLVQKGIWFSWLAGQIHDAVTAGEEHAGDWVNELKKREQS